MRASLNETRSIVIDGARRHGTAVIASSTHPFAWWQEQRVTARRRYEEAEIAYQQEVRRFFVGGMHIHAGFGTPELRIKVMTAIRLHLPLLLALSASSPFYSGQLTGLKSYRQSVIGGLPRTGMPGPNHSYADYLVGAGNATLAVANSVREEGADWVRVLEMAFKSERGGPRRGAGRVPEVQSPFWPGPEFGCHPAPQPRLFAERNRRTGKDPIDPRCPLHPRCPRKAGFPLAKA